MNLGSRLSPTEWLGRTCWCGDGLSLPLSLIQSDRTWPVPASLAQPPSWGKDTDLWCSFTPALIALQVSGLEHVGLLRVARRTGGGGAPSSMSVLLADRRVACSPWIKRRAVVGTLEVLHTARQHGDLEAPRLGGRSGGGLGQSLVHVPFRFQGA